MEMADAFLLLDRATKGYRIVRERGAFKVEVQDSARRGRASGDRLARAITLAVARAHGLEVDG